MEYQRDLTNPETANFRFRLTNMNGSSMSAEYQELFDEVVTLTGLNKGQISSFSCAEISTRLGRVEEEPPHNLIAILDRLEEEWGYDEY